ncbi:hypothetical protein [Aeromonas veronii]|uniref:hypothetical protein n=1 Tax=Aeromonas veronii TaxID=654 RepID=UPI001F0B62C1|nr:hypothetical protein [Aeromonas veronii]
MDEALRSVRRSVYPDLTTDDWKAAIPGTKIPFRWKSNGDIEDMSELLYPPLPRQIMTATAEIGKNGSENLPDSNTVRVGSRVYAPLMVAVPPREPQYFNTLFNSLNRAETRENGVTRALPYSISFMLESDGMSVMAFKSIFASLLSITSEQNRNINLATKALNEYRRDGGCIVKLRIAAMTWAGLTRTASRNWPCANRSCGARWKGGATRGTGAHRQPDDRVPDQCAGPHDQAHRRAVPGTAG